MSSSGVSLLQIPEIPIKHILEYLDFQSILILRKVCHDLRDFIDGTKPTSHLTVIIVNVTPESISFNLSLPHQSFQINYMKNDGEGCLVRCNKNGNVEEKLMGNEDFVTLFCKDFDIILRHQKTVLEEFSAFFYLSNSTTKERTLERINTSLKSMNQRLQVEQLHMGVNDHNEILSILPYIDPKPLKGISVSTGRCDNVLNLDEIGQLEQWKQAKELSVNEFQVPNLAENCQHFSKITLYSREVPTKELILLKEVFLCSSTLNRIKIMNYGNLSKDFIRQKLIEPFGQPFIDTDKDANWFFRIPGTNQLLRITNQCNYITFNRIEQSVVLENARILN